MKNLRKEKGITLVALVITIIILLILAGVAIASLQNSGLFQKTRDAVDRTEEKGIEENATLDNYEDWINNYLGKGSSTATKKTSYVVGDTVTIKNKNGEDQTFYVIEDSNESTTTVKLLAQYCLNVDTNKQDSTMGIWNESEEKTSGAVAFDSTEPYSNVYADSTIKSLVDTYVSSLDATVQEGRLIEKSEAEALETGHTDILYTASKLNYWSGSPIEGISNFAWFVIGGDSDLGNDSVRSVNNGSLFGVRPVIVVLKSNI